MAKVIILGGGVAGLSAAHELIDRGFEVEVHQSTAEMGGKARSIDKPASGIGGRRNLPGEHGFRFFPGFYKHIIATMKRIPVGGGTAFDHLVPTEQVGIAQIDKPIYHLQIRQPQTPSDWIEALFDWFGNPSLGASADEAALFAGKLLQFLTSCDERRLGEYEQLPWWDYIEADTQSETYRKLLARGLTRSLVAMRAEVASTRTIATILCQILFSIADPLGPAADRVLDLPTNDAWITHWVAYLRGRGVRFVPRSRVRALRMAGGRISEAVVSVGGVKQNVQGDYFVAAVPIEVMKTLVKPPIAQAAPSLKGLANLRTEWMTGIQFFLNRDVPLARGHVILADSPWALTCISQAQFWRGFDFTQCGNGQVRGILSVDISDWTQPGIGIPKAAQDCTRPEVQHEVWEQLKSHFDEIDPPLTDADRVDVFLDPAIVFGPPNRNREPLLINTAGSWANRPDAATGIPNLFLASDYVRTHTDLATMEGANEAARRAVNALLAVSGTTSATPCAIWPLQEPAIFDAAKTIDRGFWNLGLPHPGATIMKAIFGW